MSESGIIDFTRKIVVDYLHDHKISLNEFAKKVDIHQPNLHVFINGKGLSIKSLEKIWKYFDLNVQYVPKNQIK